MRIVLVEWVDAVFGSAGWTHEDTEHHYHKCIAIGLLHKETEDSLEIVSVKGKEEKGNIVTIPKCSVKRVRQLYVKNM